MDKIIYVFCEANIAILDKPGQFKDKCSYTIPYNENCVYDFNGHKIISVVEDSGLHVYGLFVRA